MITCHKHFICSVFPPTLSSESSCSSRGAAVADVADPGTQQRAQPCKENSCSLSLGMLTSNSFTATQLRYQGTEEAKDRLLTRTEASKTQNNPSCKCCTTQTHLLHKWFP